MTDFISRGALDLLESAFEKYYCVLLLGPRQVGKTTLARDFISKFVPVSYQATCYKDPESIDEDRISLLNFEGFVESHIGDCVVIDEAQCVPEVFPKLRKYLDESNGLEKPQIRWLILGSATDDLEGLANQHIGGRFKKVWLTPFHFSELNKSLRLDTISTLNDKAVSQVVEFKETHRLIHRLWLRGGFPRSFLADDDESSLEWRQTYTDSIFGPQSPVQSNSNNISQLMPLWKRLAIEQGKTNIERLPQRLGCSKSDLNHYLCLLESKHLINGLYFWHHNPAKQMDKQKLWYIRDSGLVHSILGLNSIESLRQHQIKGKSWEGFVLESLLTSTVHQARAFYYRSQDSDEADFVLQFENDEIWVIEVKLSGDATLSRGFYNACRDLRPSHKFVIHGGPESFKKGTEGIDWHCLPDAINQVSVRSY